jgi:hypothetical protein
MLQYLSRVDVQTNNKVRLGILTNGNVWRLYFQGALSASEDYFEIDLAKALQLPGHEMNLLDRADERLTADRALRLFMIMFGKAAFLPVEGPRTFHDLSREAGKTWEEQVTKDLSRLVFGDLFPKLVAALAKHDTARPARGPLVSEIQLPGSRAAAMSCCSEAATNARQCRRQSSGDATIPKPARPSDKGWPRYSSRALEPHLNRRRHLYRNNRRGGRSQFLAHRPASVFAKFRTSDRSHRRSSIASLVQSPRLPRGAPGLSSTMHPASLSASDRRRPP